MIFSDVNGDWPAIIFGAMKSGRFFESKIPEIDDDDIDLDALLKRRSCLASILPPK